VVGRQRGSLSVATKVDSHTAGSRVRRHCWGHLMPPRFYRRFRARPDQWNIGQRAALLIWTGAQPPSPSPSRRSRLKAPFAGLLFSTSTDGNSDRARFRCRAFCTAEVFKSLTTIKERNPLPRKIGMWPNRFYPMLIGRRLRW
jgi:hypothetical protein